MEKVKFQTKLEFLEYCRLNEVCNIIYKYGSPQVCKFDNGIERTKYFETEFYTAYVTEEPKKYPCILVWDKYGDFNDIIKGVFIYSEDF